MAERSVGSLGLLVVEDSVALGECATLDILTRDADVMAFHAKGTKSESFAGGHVNALAISDGLEAVVENTLEVAVGVETFGRVTDDIANVFQRVHIDCSWQMRQNFSGKLFW